MGSPRVILNKNSNFQFWTAGAPDDFTITDSAGAVVQLWRHMEPGHPERARFPSKLKSNDLVKDGDFAFRFVDDGTGDGSLVIDSSVVAVAPGQKISTAFMYRHNAEIGVLSLGVKLYDDVAKTTLLATVMQPAQRALLSNAVPERQTQGLPGSYDFGADPITLAEDTPPAILFWTRYGVAVVIPADCGALQATVTMESGFEGSPGVGGMAHDIDDFKIEAIDSFVHAGG